MTPRSKTAAKTSREVELEKELARLKGISTPLNLDIDRNEYIDVMSLFPGKLNLSTEKYGKGKSVSFSKFGEVKHILYNDLANIMDVQSSFLEQGYFYIVNEKVIRKHGLNDMYDKILNKEMMQKVIACDSKNAIKLYENATPVQKEILDSMIVAELKEDNPNMDFNIVSKISKIAKKDLVKLAEEAKQIEASTVNLK